jgi:hypothetical protein
VAGAVAVAVTTGGSSARALEEAGADVVLPGLTGFAEWFGEWFTVWSSTASSPGLDHEPGEGDRESDRAQQGQRGHDAGR